MKCRECNEVRDPGLKYCAGCGSRQISLVGAVDLYLILWFILVIPVYLGESALSFGSGADLLGLYNYLLIAGADAILVIAIFLYGGKIAERIGASLRS
jgi:hypothetical protein